MKEPACYERGTKRATGFDSEASWKLSSARGTLRKQRACEQAIDHIIKRFHEEKSIMSGLFSQNSMLLCGMQGNNSCRSHRTISVKIETFFCPPSKTLLCVMRWIIYFQHTRIAFCPKILQRKKKCCKAKKTANDLSRHAVHECTGFYMYLINPCVHYSVIKTESIRKLSNFNFQWTKTLYQNNLNIIALFCRGLQM